MHATAPQPRAPRLPYLDGLRAIAAVYVILFHAVLGFAGSGLTGIWGRLRVMMGFGHEAVAVFIVLSGYCLMLPVVVESGRDPTRAFGTYIGRRARRILPPYFAVVALSLLAIAIVPSLSRMKTGTIWDDSLPAFELAPILAHLLVVHNWFPDLVYRINGPLWSVASEWQIYFFFPLLLLPIWRRFGVLATWLTAAVIGYAPLLFSPARAASANSWYLLLFVAGMTAAWLNFGRDVRESLRVALLKPWVSAALWLLCAAVALGLPRVWFRFKPATDLGVGLATAALLIYLSGRAALGQRGLLLRLLESKLAQGVGHFSYSVYLTHLPVVACVYFALLPLGLSAPVLACATVGLGVVASLIVAYVFHLAVERPFMNTKPAPRKAVTDADPAPVA